MDLNNCAPVPSSPTEKDRLRLDWYRSAEQQLEVLARPYSYKTKEEDRAHCILLLISHIDIDYDRSCFSVRLRIYNGRPTNQFKSASFHSHERKQRNHFTVGSRRPTKVEGLIQSHNLTLATKLISQSHCNLYQMLGYRTLINFPDKKLYTCSSPIRGHISENLLSR